MKERQSQFAISLSGSACEISDSTLAVHKTAVFTKLVRGYLWRLGTAYINFKCRLSGCFLVIRNNLCVCVDLSPWMKFGSRETSTR